MRRRPMIVMLGAVTAGCADVRPDTVPKPDTPRSAVTLRLGSVDRNGDYFTMPLEASREERGISYSSESGSRSMQVNRLIVDSRTLQRRWLLPDNTRRVVSWYSGDRIMDSAASTASGDAAVPIYAAVVEQPRRQTDRNAIVDILVGRFDRARQRVAVVGAEKVGDLWRRSDGALVVVTVRAGATRAQVFDPDTLGEVQAAVLANAPGQTGR